jgi:hypothetical protein
MARLLTSLLMACSLLGICGCESGDHDRDYHHDGDYHHEGDRDRYDDRHSQWQGPRDLSPESAKWNYERPGQPLYVPPF